MVHPLTAAMMALVIQDGYSVHLSNGKQRMHWLRQAWNYGKRQQRNGIVVSPLEICELGRIVEPVKNMRGLRLSRKSHAPEPAALSELLFGLCRTTPICLPMNDHAAYLTVTDWLYLFQLFDPFVEGTARVALVLEAWHYSEFRAPQFFRFRAGFQGFQP